MPFRIETRLYNIALHPKSIRISLVLKLLLRSIEFGFYHVLLTVVDKVSELPRNTMLPEAMRLYRENIALKAQLDAFQDYAARLEKHKSRPKPLSVRAAQVFAMLLTRGNKPFQRYHLTGALATIKRWHTKFLGRLRRAPGGRPPLDESVEQLILTLKEENASWGVKRISQQLKRMGVRASAPTIRRVLTEHDLLPSPTRRKLDFSRVRSAAKDALWAMDYFAVRTATNSLLQVLLVVDLYTREVLGFRVYDGWDVDSQWTSRAFNEIRIQSGRKPAAVLHDHGTTFMGQFERQMRVLEIEQRRTPTGLPSMNCYAEGTIGFTRRELLRHIRAADATELQAYLDEYCVFRNTERAHQGILGLTPEEKSREAKPPEPLSLDAIREKKLERRLYANGLLTGYSLVDNDVARKAA